MNEDDEVVTRGILRQELARYPTREELREELARFVTRDEFGMWMHEIGQQHEHLVAAIAGLRSEMRAGHETLWQAMKASHDALFVEIGRAAQVAAEEHRRELGVLDDRYRDLPVRVTTLEQDLDVHRSDASLHPPRPTRPRRRPPRR